MKNWRLLKQGIGKWLRFGSMFIIIIMLFAVLLITNGVLAAPHHEQKATEHKEVSATSISPFKQQIVVSPDYNIHQGMKSYIQACPSGTTLTGGGYQLLKGRSGVTFPASYPSPTNSSVWTVTINNPTSDEAVFRVYTVCVSAQPPSSTPTPRPMPTPTHASDERPQGGQGGQNGQGGSQMQDQGIKLKF